MGRASFHSEKSWHKQGCAASKLQHSVWREGTPRIRDASSAGAEAQLGKPDVVVIPPCNNAKSPQLVENLNLRQSPGLWDPNKPPPRYGTGLQAPQGPSPKRAAHPNPNSSHLSVKVKSSRLPKHVRVNLFPHSSAGKQILNWHAKPACGEISTLFIHTCLPADEPVLLLLQKLVPVTK